MKEKKNQAPAIILTTVIKNAVGKQRFGNNLINTLIPFSAVKK